MSGAGELISPAKGGKDDSTLLTITQGNYSEENIKHSEENWKIVNDQMKKLIDK